MDQRRLPFGFSPEHSAGVGMSPGANPRSAGCKRSMATGALAFGAASLLVFGSWAWMGRWLYGSFGEAGTYALWAAVFIGVAGAGLRQLLIVPVPLTAFLRFFLVAFGAYALAWSLVWFATQTRSGEWLASLLGTLCFSVVLCWAFGAWRRLLRVAVVLFALHSAGYFAGGWLHAWVLGGNVPADWLGKAARADISKLLWGAAYGFGFGAGLGYAFHSCQRVNGGTSVATSTG